MSNSSMLGRRQLLDLFKVDRETMNYLINLDGFPKKYRHCRIVNGKKQTSYQWERSAIMEWREENKNHEALNGHPQVPFSLVKEFFGILNASLTLTPD